MTAARNMPRSLVRAALIVAALASLAWVSVDRWYGYHMPLVTGVRDVPRRSCLYCHLPVETPTRADEIVGRGDISPAGIAVSPDGSTLYVAANTADLLLVIDIASGEVLRSIAMPGRPHGVAISADGTTVAVTCNEADVVRIVDTSTRTIRETLATGREPFGVTLSGDAASVRVANGSSGTVALMPVTAGDSPAITLSAGLQPFALAGHDHGQLLAVSSRLARAASPRAEPTSEITLIDVARRRVVDRRILRSAHMSEGIALSADGSFALASIVQVRNLLPITQVARGALVTSAIAFVETEQGGRTVQLPLDEVNRFYADPSGVAISADDRLAFVAAGGANIVTVLDVQAIRSLVSNATADQLATFANDLGLHARYVLARIPTRANPRALALSPDGRELYVAERLADSIAVIDTRELVVTRRIDLGGRRTLTAERRGEIAFHDASVTFQGQFSCHTCHPDGHSDGLSYDFVIDGVDRNRLESRSLRGLRDTAPFKWNVKNPDLKTQCGPRFALVLTKSEPFPPEELDDLVTYLESIPLPAQRTDVTSSDAIERGRLIFDRKRTNTGEPIPRGLRCVTCHRPPLFTDRLLRDVASKADSDTRASFDTPHLLDIRSSAPYLHDGRAWSLEELWTVYNPDDTHGMTNDLSKVELNDLVLYLRSL